MPPLHDQRLAGEGHPGEPRTDPRLRSESRRGHRQLGRPDAPELLDSQQLRRHDGGRRLFHRESNGRRLHHRIQYHQLRGVRGRSLADQRQRHLHRHDVRGEFRPKGRRPLPGGLRQGRNAGFLRLHLQRQPGDRGDGGAIATYGGEASISRSFYDCTLADNTSAGNAGVGGVYAYQGGGQSYFTFQGTLFANNSNASLGSDGTLGIDYFYISQGNNLSTDGVGMSKGGPDRLRCRPRRAGILRRPDADHPLARRAAPPSTRGRHRRDRHRPARRGRARKLGPGHRRVRVAAPVARPRHRRRTHQRRRRVLAGRRRTRGTLDRHRLRRLRRHPRAPPRRPSPTAPVPRSPCPTPTRPRAPTRLP